MQRCMSCACASSRSIRSVAFMRRSYGNHSMETIHAERCGRTVRYPHSPAAACHASCVHRFLSCSTVQRTTIVSTEQTTVVMKEFIGDIRLRNTEKRHMYSCIGRHSSVNRSLLSFTTGRHMTSVVSHRFLSCFTHHRMTSVCVEQTNVMPRRSKHDIPLVSNALE